MPHRDRLADDLLDRGVFGRFRDDHPVAVEDRVGEALGRGGGIVGRRPQISLGDPIFRGEEKVGVVTGLIWNRVNGSLDIEFDPVDHARICVGDEVWMSLDAKATSPNPAR